MQDFVHQQYFGGSLLGSLLYSNGPKKPYSNCFRDSIQDSPRRRNWKTEPLILEEHILEALGLGFRVV